MSIYGIMLALGLLFAEIDDLEVEQQQEEHVSLWTWWDE